jgi:hypothetical protein
MAEILQPPTSNNGPSRTRRSRGRRNHQVKELPPPDKKTRRGTRGRGRQTPQQVRRRLDRLEDDEQDEDYVEISSDADDDTDDISSDLVRPQPTSRQTSKRKADEPLPSAAPKRRKRNLARPANFRAEDVNPPEATSDDRDDHARLVCLVAAFDDPVFRNTVAMQVWAFLRVHCPRLRPWHAVNLTDPYPGDRPEYQEAREQDLSLLSSCVVFGPGVARGRTTIPCKQVANSAHTVVIKETWLVLLACGLVSKAEWAEMILAGKRREGHDLEGSHLCGNSSCGSPWHLVAETHSQNMARKACHKDDRCKCKQPIRCQVSPNRRQMADKESEWQTALENAQGWVYECAECDFNVAPSDDLELVHLAKLMATHFHEEHSSTASSIRVEVPDSQSPEPRPARRSAAPPNRGLSKKTAPVPKRPLPTVSARSSIPSVPTRPSAFKNTRR